MLIASNRSLKVGLVADELTSSCLAREVDTFQLSPSGSAAALRQERPDFIFVESAWFGHQKSWKYKIATYPRLWFRTNRAIVRLVKAARDMGIPTVFWNKEDGVHFNRFIDSARHFDHVFTVDSQCVSRYKQVMGQDASVSVLPFAIQPLIHNFTGFNFVSSDANFVGSYSMHVHDARRAWQDMVFRETTNCGMRLAVYDRNSDRSSQNYRYPSLPGLTVHPAVHHSATAQVYKDHLVSLNVNTVTDSPTMFSRRLVEILACGGIAVTNRARSVETLFNDYCHIVDTAEEARAVLGRLRHGPSADDLDKAREGSRHVLARHTWAQRLEQVAATVLA